MLTPSSDRPAAEWKARNEAAVGTIVREMSKRRRCQEVNKQGQGPREKTGADMLDMSKPLAHDLNILLRILLPTIFLL